MYFCFQETPKHEKQASESTFLITNLKKFYIKKVTYFIFMHKFHLFGWPSQNCIRQTIFSANAVIFADFAFRHDRSNNMSLQMGQNWVFSAKISLGTLKWTHLFYSKWTFISNPTWIQGGQKIRKIYLLLIFSGQMSLQMGPDGNFSAKFSLGLINLTNVI